MENLAVASVVGFIAIVVAALGLFADAAAASRERSAIAALSGGSVDDEARRFDDPAFSRIHLISEGSAPFGAVLGVPTRQGAFRAALLFRDDGGVAAARALGPRPAPAWLELFVGRAGASALPSSKSEAADPDVVSGATESFLAWSDAIGRASAKAASLSGAGR
jgi:hypothetical protein